MKFTVEREHLLKSLQQVINLLSNRSTLPILSNLLFRVIDNRLFVVGTDLEIEIAACITLSFPHNVGEITVSARKFFDICRGLPGGSKILVQLKDNRILICSGRSRFFLSTLPAADFPNLDNWESKIELTLSQTVMKQLIESTRFAMANQDVRYYLNGMLLEIEGKELRAVATDGHRLAVCSMSIDMASLPNYSIIIPRKGVIELMRMLDNSDTLFRIQISSSNIRAYIRNFVFTSKLIDGRFPDYHRILLKKPDKTLEVSCDILKQALVRAAILSNERFRGVHLYIDQNRLSIIANNSEQEEAEEILDVLYAGIKTEISFNVGYVLDVLNVLKCEKVRIMFTDSVSSIRIEGMTSQSAVYVVMPMRL